MTSFQIYAAYGAPALLFAVCVAVALTVRPKKARLFRKEQAPNKAIQQEAVLRKDVAELRARLDRIQTQMAADRMLIQSSFGHSNQKHRARVLQHAKARRVRAVEADVEDDTFGLKTYSRSDTALSTA